MIRPQQQRQPYVNTAPIRMPAYNMPPRGQQPMQFQQPPPPPGQQQQQAQVAPQPQQQPQASPSPYQHQANIIQLGHMTNMMVSHFF